MEPKIYAIDTQQVDLSEIDFPGPTLDIGGGGEGVIGQINDEELIVIDQREDELLEASSGGIKLVMDAGDLKFLDNSFAHATSFFTFMYIPPEEHQRVFAQIYRVLKEGGQFWVWDVQMPDKGAREENVFVVPLQVKLKGKEIETGYGVVWNREQDLNYYRDLGENNGFFVLEASQFGETFFLRLQKKK